MLQLLLHLLIQVEAFGWIRLGYRRQRGFVQLRDLPAIKPGHGAGFAVVPGEGAGIGVRIKIIRDPQTDGSLVLFSAHAGIDLAARCWQQINLHAALGKARLH